MWGMLATLASRSPAGPMTAAVAFSVVSDLTGYGDSIESRPLELNRP